MLCRKLLASAISALALVGGTMVPAFAADDHIINMQDVDIKAFICLLYTSPSPRDLSTSRMPSSA